MAAETRPPEEAHPAGSVAAATQPRPGLLDYLAATALDADYARVAEQHSPRGRRRRPGVRGLLVLAVFGLIVATAGVETARNRDESATSRSSLVAQVHDGRQELAQRRTRLSTLQQQVTQLQARRLAATAQGRRLDRTVAALGLLTGAAPARGPGVSVVVGDNPRATSYQEQVHAGDLQRLVNALWQVGAEAIAINGHRLSALSSIRDAGSAITVNYVSLRGPYTVEAIGPVDTMQADLLTTAGGAALQTLRSTFGLRLSISDKDSMVLPAVRHLALREARSAADDVGGRR